MENARNCCFDRLVTYSGVLPVFDDRTRSGDAPDGQLPPSAS
jgi:hypothetical protein